jgi:small subunit ribosomal protein S1
VEEPTPAPVVAETSEATPGEAPKEDEKKEDDKATQLPRVVLEPGAPFVGLVHNDGGRGGYVVLTHHPKRVQKAKPVVAEASKSGSLVFGLVTGTIKGGVEVDVDGLRAFAPASHVELRPGADLSHLVGKRLAFAVTQYAKRGRDVVLSRRAMLESEAKEKREKALATLKIGEVVEGVVRTVVPFGAFVDVGGVEGLVPLSEMSHNRADQPKDVFKVNDPVKVKILRVDEKGKLWLSRRSAIEDPWASVAAKYSLHSKHKGKIARLQPFGAFVELEPGIDGLIHTADLSVKRIEHPEEVVKVGDEIEVVVANVDPKAHRIALHPAPTGEAANEEPQKIQVHKVVKVVVVAVENSGLQVRVRGATGRNARGFISASSTGTPRGTELRKLFPVGKELEAKIIEHDPRRGELKLSIRALNEENERNAYQQYRAQVKREAKFGTFADLLAKRNITPNK